MEHAIRSINKGTSRFVDFLDFLGNVNTKNITKYKPYLQKAVQILRDLDRNILSTPIVKKVIKVIDRSLLEEQKEDHLVEFINKLSKEMIKKKKKNQSIKMR